MYYELCPPQLQTTALDPEIWKHRLKKINTTFLMSGLYLSKKITEVLGAGQVIIFWETNKLVQGRKGKTIIDHCRVAVGVWRSLYAHACVCTPTHICTLLWHQRSPILYSRYCYYLCREQESDAYNECLPQINQLHAWALVPGSPHYTIFFPFPCHFLQLFSETSFPSLPAKQSQLPL